MAVTARRRREWELLRADQKRLSQLLDSIAAATKAAAELAASVQRRLAEQLEERAADMIDAELKSVLASAVRLRLQLLFEPAGVRTVIDLPHDGTVADLQEAVHSAGGPIPVLQVLAVGGERLLCLGRTRLSDTHTCARLLRPDVCVTVRQRDPRRRCISIGNMALQNQREACVPVRSVAVLESGEVWYSDDRYGDADAEPSARRQRRDDAAPVFDSGGNVESVHCAGYHAAAIVDGRLEVQPAGALPAWWSDALSERTVVSFSAERFRAAAVDSSGQLFLPTPAPAVLAGRAAAVSVGLGLVAVLTRSGEVCTLDASCPAEGAVWMDLGGRAAVAVSAGSRHCAALLDDGSVRCFGDSTYRQCDVPVGLRDVVSVECGTHCTFALQADGRVTWWGGKPTLSAGRRLDDQAESVDLFPASFNAGRCAAIAAGSHGLLTATADGRLAHYRFGDGRELPFARPPSGRVAIV